MAQEFKRALFVALAEKMDSLKDDRLLQQEHFFCNVYNSAPDLFKTELLNKAALYPYCGTSACALGWATTIPEWKAAGLIWQSRIPAFNNDEFLYETLGITWAQYNWIFGGMPATPSEKAAQIRKLIALYDAKGNSDVQT